MELWATITKKDFNYYVFSYSKHRVASRMQKATKSRLVGQLSCKVPQWRIVDWIVGGLPRWRALVDQLEEDGAPPCDGVHGDEDGPAEDLPLPQLPQLLLLHGEATESGSLLASMISCWGHTVCTLSKNLPKLRNISKSFRDAADEDFWESICVCTWWRCLMCTNKRSMHSRTWDVKAGWP